MLESSGGREELHSLELMALKLLDHDENGNSYYESSGMINHIFQMNVYNVSVSRVCDCNVCASP